MHEKLTVYLFFYFHLDSRLIETHNIQETIEITLQCTLCSRNLLGAHKQAYYITQTFVEDMQTLD